MPADDAEFTDHIARAVARLDPSLAKRLGTDPAAHLELVLLTRRVHQETNRLLHDAVASARGAGSSWEAIGSAMGMSRQAAQQRFGRAPVAGPGSPEHRQLVGLTAFNEIDQLNAWGRHGWHSIAFGPMFHHVEQSPVQWEHARAVVGSRRARELESAGWERIGSMWFPWIYLKRPLDLPAASGEPSS
ncbi:hypothetical protein [Aeromicrobium wangtongii]|uniref:Uncharacterized protein n=1 Tax=Aeromicrobium wangtongii TaxID=2969247 RepID=A0ABY5M8N1_9ACTN|nr:hypothetical protein [Aeromicrobium wangtongii]MCD9200045.1 hypothetical protein [Aeromicrobium wangtongii]UUP13304.1 hypothetical protein NQV15_15855 [Aeromicrobium wangtongii]